MNTENNNVELEVNDRFNKYQSNYLKKLEENFIEEHGEKVLREHGHNIPILGDSSFLKAIFQWVIQNSSLEFLDKLLVTKNGKNAMQDLYDQNWHIDLTFDDIYHESFCSFTSVFHFINKIIKLYKPDNIIDLACDDLSFIFLERYENYFAQIIPLEKKQIKIPSYLKIVKDPKRVENSILSNFFKKKSIDKKKNKQKFDMVFLSLSLVDRLFRADLIKKNRRRTLEFSIKKLSPNGKLITIIETKFLTKRSDFRDFLSKNKIFIQGVFELYNSSSSILILSREENKEFFNGKIFQTRVFGTLTNQEMEANNKVFKNFTISRQGSLSQFGRLISSDEEFKGIDYLSWLQKTGEKFLSTKIKKQKFGDYIKKINTTEENDLNRSPWKKKENFIYFLNHKNQFQLDTAEPSEFDFLDQAVYERPSSFIQIELNENCLNEYVYHYFKSELGSETIRVNHPIGATQFLTEYLEETYVYFPSINLQKEIVQKMIDIKNLVTKSDEMKKKLFDSSIYLDSNLKKISIELEKINSLESWYKTLPFPLSTILRRYETFNKNQVKEKVESLIDFFRAYSIFLCIIIVSSLVHNDKPFYRNNIKNRLFDGHKNLWLKQPGFGDWFHLLKNIATLFDEMLKEYDREKLFSLLGNPSNSFVEMITSKKIIKILDTLREIKNKWKSHGGLVNESRQIERLDILTKKLSLFRAEVKNSFDDVNIFIAGSGEYDGEIINYDIKHLNGFAFPLKSGTIKSINNLISGKLYVTHGDNLNPMYILPLMKFVEEKNAYYFINSFNLGNESLSFVSYNYEDSEERDVSNMTEKFKEVINSFRSD